MLSANAAARALFQIELGDVLEVSRDTVACALAGEERATAVLLGGAPHDLSVAPLRDEGRVVGAILVARSTADRALAERMRVALQAAGLVTWEWDITSDRGHRDRGEDFGEPASSHERFFELIHTDDRARVAAVLRASLEHGAPYAVHYRKEVRGELRRFEATAEVLRDEDGRPARLVGSARDVTERTLLEEQLQRAQKMEAVARLAGGVAHDFNNVLTAITSYAHLLKLRLATDRETVEDLDEMLTATQRAATMTRQLLAFSKQQPTEATHVDVASIVREVATMVPPLVGEDIVLTLALSPKALVVRADAVQIQQVLLNLVMNARDAMPSGGRLSLSTAFVEIGLDHPTTLSPGAYATLTVRDDGAGMSEGTLARVFEPFFTTKPAGLGTGLGLSTAWAIVARHGGRIAIDSEVGVGTRVSVYLPLRGADEATASAEQTAPPARTTAPAALILLVEDDGAVRSVAKRVLALRSYRVIEAENGREALEIFDRGEHAFDLVLTDVVMPFVGGMALAKALHERAPTLPIVFTSGYTDDDVLNHGVAAGEVVLLRKPYTPDALLAVVAATLASRRDLASR